MEITELEKQITDKAYEEFFHEIYELEKKLDKLIKEFLEKHELHPWQIDLGMEERVTAFSGKGSFNRLVFRANPYTESAIKRKAIAKFLQEQQRLEAERHLLKNLSCLTSEELVARLKPSDWQHLTRVIKDLTGRRVSEDEIS